MCLRSRKGGLINLVMRVCNRFSTFKNPGISAENFVRLNVLKPAGLKLRKLTTKFKKLTPDGYILDKNNLRIALVEIKCIFCNETEEANQYVLGQAQKTIKKFKIPGGGYFSIRYKHSISKNNWLKIKKNLKQKLNEYVQEKKTSGKILADCLEIVFTPIKHRRTWRWGTSHGPMVMGTDSMRIERRLSEAKKQLKQHVSNLPKIIFLVIDAGNIHKHDMSAGIIGSEVLSFPLGAKTRPNFTYEGYRNKKKNRFNDAYLSGVITVIPHYIDKAGLNYRLWIYHNNYCQILLPGELRQLPGVEFQQKIGHD